MNLRKTCLVVLALGLLGAGPALAKQGKAGLWNVTSTTDIALPPETMAAMKKAGVAMPAAQPVTVQMCMSQAEVDSDNPPQMDRQATGCDTRIVKRTANAMTASMVCKGNLKGTGSIQIAYEGAERYAGTYSFKGATGGQATNVTTRFRGQWLKTDCGKVKPYALRTQ
jgi:hypothetical protein